MTKREAVTLCSVFDDPERPDFERVRRIKAARKRHLCSFCESGYIEPGESYNELVTIDDGRFSRKAYCWGSRRGCLSAKEKTWAGDLLLRECFLDSETAGNGRRRNDPDAE